MRGSFHTTPTIRRELVKTGRATASDITEWVQSGDITEAEAEEFRATLRHPCTQAAATA